MKENNSEYGHVGSFYIPHFVHSYYFVSIIAFNLECSTIYPTNADIECVLKTSYLTELLN